ncbi:MAG: hypothetical protein FJZ66_02935 [Bacteroidetes bacterium]|nr:hypothetical protein [Bacteroidota bacterium]
MKQFIVFLFFIQICNLHYAQQSKVLNAYVTKLNSVKDYSVNAKIVAAVPMIKIKEVNAIIYFKQKDKFKIETKGIAVLPKQGFLDLNKFLATPSKYMAIESAGKEISGVQTTMVTVIPIDESTDVILAKLWIDSKRNIIMTSQLTTKSSGMLTTTYAYADQIPFGLPSSLVFEIDVKKFKMPKSVAANIHQTNKSTNNNKDQKGKITVYLTGYKVNKGLSDSIFK